VFNAGAQAFARRARYNIVRVEGPAGDGIRRRRQRVPIARNPFERRSRPIV